MRVVEATERDRDAWDAFSARAPSGSFLQSWGWGMFQEAAGFRIRRLVAAEERGAMVAVCLLVERPLPFGQRSWYAPWGPVVAGRVDGGAGKGGTVDTNVLEETLRGMRTVVGGGSGLAPVYLRAEPKVPHDPPVISAVRRAGFAVLGRGVQPRDTLVLDLTQSEDDLLRGMHPKTRYNIRLAVRHGAVVEEQGAAPGVETFLTLAHEVQGKGVFHYHPDAYYRALGETLHPPTALRVLVTVHKGMPLAAGLFIRFGSTVTYAHGASTVRRKHVMAPHLLHWEAMRRAKADGATEYDFFGIAPTNSPLHPWAGITRFKQGFGGTTEHAIGICDAILDPVRYRLYTIARGLRGITHT